MSRVFRVQFILFDEDEPDKALAKKQARIHETDIEAGIFHFELKRRELFRDIAVELGKDYHALDCPLVTVEKEQTI